MDLLPFDLIPIIFNNITSIMDKRQFMKTCVAYHKMTKKSVETLNKQIVIKHFVYCIKNYYKPKPIKLLARQPPEGRRELGGGLRLGTMERDALIEHGFHYLKKSNTNYFHACTNCGLIIKAKLICYLCMFYCNTCNENNVFNLIQVPTTFIPFVEKIKCDRTQLLNNNYIKISSV